ncbi:MAG: MFS transporter [Pyrinomonadaceae bacterium]
METTPEKTDEIPASTGYLDLIRQNREFRRIWLGQVVSQMGDWFDSIAVYTLVLALTGSSRAVSLILIARFLPTFFFGPIAGVLADRFDRKRIMIVTDGLRALIVLGFLFVDRPERIWLAYVLTVLQLTVSTFFEPARSAVIPSVVNRRDLVRANTISSATWSVVLAVGAGLGGLVTSWLGTKTAFALDSLSYFLSAVLIFGVTLPKHAPRLKGVLSLAKVLGITDTIEGARYVWQHPRVLAAMLVKPAWGLGGGALTILVVFGDKIFPVAGRPALGMGILFAARGFGTAVGPILARRMFGEARDRLELVLGLSFFVGAVFYVIFGTATIYPLAILALMISHAGSSVQWVNSTVLLQSSVEDGFRGRVFAAELALLTLTLATTTFATGELLDRFHWSPRRVAVLIGLLWLIPGTIWFATRRWWAKD